MLDFNTLLIASIAARAGLALFYLLFSIFGAARVAFLWWLLNIVLSCAAMWLLYGKADASLPGPLLGAIIYMAFGLSNACLWSGACAYFERPIGWAEFFVAGLAPGLTYGGVSLVAPTPLHALTPVLFMLAYAVFRTALVFFVNRRPGLLPSQWVVTCTIALYALALAVSGVMVGLSLSGPLPPRPPAPEDKHYALFIDQIACTLIYLGLIAMTLEHAQARLRDSAATDPLTGLANRRGAKERSLAVIAAGRRAGRPMAVLLADIDHFKAINDRYGHETGDLVLQAFARRLDSIIQRKQDVVARWGGEEFLVILHGATGAEALQVAERVCVAMASEPVSAAKQSIDVTVSVGVASFHPGEVELEPVIGRADAALYDAKRGGRNRAILATASPAGAELSSSD